MDEDALIRAAKGGDLDSFNRLVLANQDVAFNVASHLMGDPDQAADATQTAFISAFRKLKSFRGGSFRAWILRIVTNACFDELRRRKRYRTIPLPTSGSGDENMDTPAWLNDPGELPEEAVQRGELRQVIERCIAELSPEFRAVITLVDVQGLEYVEAASALDSPVGTIKSRLARARVRVQECLQRFRELLPLAFRFESGNEL